MNTCTCIRFGAGSQRLQVNLKISLHHVCSYKMDRLHPKTHNAEHIGVGLLNVSQHIANMGLSDLIEGMRHQDTSLSGY